MATRCCKAQVRHLFCSNCIIANKQCFCQDVLAGTKLPCTQRGGKQQLCMYERVMQQLPPPRVMLFAGRGTCWPLQRNKSSQTTTPTTNQLEVACVCATFGNEYTVHFSQTEQHVCAAAEMTVPSMYFRPEYPCAGHMQRLLKGC